MAYTNFFAHFRWGVIPWGKLSVCGAAYVVGSYIDYYDGLTYTMFRDKSALFGRELKEGEEPSWPRSHPFHV